MAADRTGASVRRQLPHRAKQDSGVGRHGIGMLAGGKSAHGGIMMIDVGGLVISLLSICVSGGEAVISCRGLIDHSFVFLMKCSHF